MFKTALKTAFLLARNKKCIHQVTQQTKFYIAQGIKFSASSMKKVVEGEIAHEEGNIEDLSEF